MRIKRVSALAIGIAVTSTLALSPAISSASSRPDDFFNLQLCPASVEGLSACVSANGTSGDEVYGKASDSGHEQNMSVEGDYACPGPSHYVTNLCPFTPGSNFNTEFHGKEIVDMSNNYSGLVYFGAAANLDVVQGFDGSRSGEAWIQLGDPGSGNAQYVNVNVSDAEGNAMYLCAAATNHPLILGTLGCASYWGNP